MAKVGPVDPFLHRPMLKISGPSIRGLSFYGRTVILRSAEQELTEGLMRTLHDKFGVKRIELRGRESFTEEEISSALRWFAAKSADISLSKGCVKTIVFSREAGKKDFLISKKPKEDASVRIFITVPAQPERIGETLEAARNALVGELRLRAVKG